MKRHLFLVLCVLPFLFAADLRFAQNDLGFGRYIAASRGFRSVLKADPENDLASLGLARAQVAMGRCERAYPRLMELRQSAAWTHEASNAEGICLLRAGRLLQAVAAFEESIQLRVDYPVAWYGLFQASIRLNDNDTAKRAMEELQRLVPGKTLAQVAFMDWLQRTDPETSDMELEIQKQDVRVFGKPAIRRQWAMIEARRWLHLGHPSAAISVLEPIWSRYPSNVQTSALIAEAYRRAGDADSAESCLSHALIMVSEHPVILGVRARIAADQGKPKQALQYLQQMKNHNSEERFATQWYVYRNINPARAQYAKQRWWGFSHLPNLALNQYVPWRR